MLSSPTKLSTALHQAYEDLPGFSDIFDEEGFYLAFVGLTVGSILVAYIASKFITIRDADI